MIARLQRNNKDTTFTFYVLGVFFVIITLMIGYYLVFVKGRGNFREVIEGKVYRSGQCSVSRLESLIKQYHIKTIINLRGYHGGAAGDAEKKLSDELGVKYVLLNLKANAQLSSEDLRELIDKVETAQTPLLVHCRHGVDRAGTASVLAAMALGNIEFDKAKWQAYVPFGPWKRRKKGDYAHISDILVQYEQYCSENGLTTDGWSQFKSWSIKLE